MNYFLTELCIEIYLTILVLTYHTYNKPYKLFCPLIFLVVLQKAKKDSFLEQCHLVKNGLTV